MGSNSRQRDVRSEALLWARHTGAGDLRAREELVERYAGLAHTVASAYSGRGVPDEDLRQVAMLALVRAVDRFDPSRGCCFGTYAVPTIRGEIKRYFRDCGWGMRIPRELRDLAVRIRRTLDPLTLKLGRSPTTGDLAAELGVSLERIEEAMAIEDLRHIRSLDGEYSATDVDGSMPLDEVFGAEDPELMAAEDRIGLDQAIEALPDRLKRLLRLRHARGLSQKDVGAELGISQMQVSRLERRALAELRSMLSGA